MKIGLLSDRCRVRAASACWTAAVDLLQRQGYHGTGLNELLERSGAPRGSLYHYFPGGKEQIGAEAIARAGGQVAAAVVHLLRAKPSVADAVEALAGLLAAGLEASAFERGCPVATTALEVTPRSEPIRAAAQASFESWLAPLRERLEATGFEPRAGGAARRPHHRRARGRARAGPRAAECRRAARSRAPAAPAPATPGGLMQQLTMTADRQVEWWDVPAPALQGPGEALVRPLAVALCDLDQPILRGDAPDPGADRHRPRVRRRGDRGRRRRARASRRATASSSPSRSPAARARAAAAGQTGDCTSVPPRSMYGFGAFGGDWGGALSDLVRVPFADAMLVAAPAGHRARRAGQRERQHPRRLAHRRAAPRRSARAPTC